MAASNVAAVCCEHCEHLDEAEFEAEEPIAEEIGEMIVKAIAWAGKFLKLNVPLDGESKTGKSWMEVH